jgi:hypothetical protein
MKQKFKGEVLTMRKCVNSILRYYALSSASETREGLNWYTEANDYCKQLAERFNVSIQQVSGIVAAFSPQAGWQDNKRYALSYLISPKNQLRSLAQQLKAKKIMTLKNEDAIYHSLSTDKIPKAFKTKAFFLNILHPDVVTDVTIDRHAIAACIQSTDNVQALSKEYGKLTKAQYDFFQKAYVMAANEANIFPHQMQAIVWTVYRRLRDLKKYDGTTDWKPFDENNNDMPF